MAKLYKFNLLRISLLSAFLIISVFTRVSFAQLFSAEKKNSEQDTSYRLTDVVCSYVEKLYVYPEKIEPDKLLQQALVRLENVLPELLVDIDEDTGLISIHVDNKSLELNSSKVTDLKNISTELKKAFSFVAKNKQTEKISSDDIMYEGLNGMLTRLDPHTVVLPPKAFDEFKIGTSGQFGGLGMVVGIREGVLSVISPIEGTPAFRAGLKAGDQIIEIDGESTINLTLSESVNKLRGKPKTPVTLSVLKYKAAKPQTITIIREIIRIPTVDDKILEDGIGYIKIRNFQNDTAMALAEHIKNIKKSSDKIKGMIIDLRNNSGGLLDQAIEVSDQFLDSGNIVSTVGPGGKNKEIQRAKKARTDELDFPIVLLINASSASGAEIVVGALKENNRGVVIGNRSFGKGSVQQLIDLINGAALKLTMAKYLTPFFNEVQAKGISPDIFFTPVTISEDDINLFREHIYIREEDLIKHGEKKTKPIRQKPLKKVKEIKYLKESVKKAEVDEDGDDPAIIEEDPYKAGDLSKDNLVQFAIMIIKNTVTPERKAILKEIDNLLEKVSQTEEKKIFNALKEIGINWADGESETGQPAPVASIEFFKSVSDDDDNQDSEKLKPISNIIQAGEKIAITVKVENKGKGTIYRVRGISESDNLYFDNREFVFGKIKAGETKSYTKTIEIPKNVIKREDEISIQFDESNGNAPDDIKTELRVEPQERPKFAYTYQINDKGIEGKKGNNDGLIQKGEDIDLILHVKNIGKGKAEKVSVVLKNITEDEIFVKKGRIEIEELLPGETESVNMEFNIKENVSFEKFDVDALIRDSIFGVYLADTINFSIAPKNAVSLLSSVRSRLKVIKDNAVIFSNRENKNEPIAILKKGALLNSDGWAPGLYRIDISSNIYGWIPASNVEKIDAKKHSKTEEHNIDILMQRVPPTISFLNENVDLISDKDIFTLTGTIDDDNGVKNIYTFVNNDKIYFKSLVAERQHNGKLNGMLKNSLNEEQTDIAHELKRTGNETEQSSTNGKKLDFTTEIQLKEGANTITVVARDKDDLITSRSFVITKRKSE